MPELPEVETIRSQITPLLPMQVEKIILSDKITSIIKDKKQKKDFSNFKNCTLLEIKRHAKFMLWIFDNGFTAISHLGMSGSWRISNSPLKDVLHNHVQIKGLDRNKKPLILNYVDPRRFGKLKIYKNSDPELLKHTSSIDVSSDKFTSEHIFNLTKKYPDRILKPALLDQENFGGVGNYIACEICAIARLMPDRAFASLNKKDCEKIVKATRIVIEGQIKNQGNTFSGGYKDAFGEDGGGLANLLVFHQDICGICKKTKVKKIILGQRGTYYCPNCQV